MEITVEISYFPLMEDYQQSVDEFIGALNNNAGIRFEPGTMSSLITGPYDEVMRLVQHEMKPLMKKYPSVFTIKVSNSCNACMKRN